MPRKYRKTYAKPSETILIAIEQLFEKIITSDESEFPLPSSLTAEERAYVHEKARTLGLKSKSRGKGDKRVLTIYKIEGSTIVQKDAVLHLTSPCRQILESLTNRCPLTHRERQELLPPTERDRNQSMDLVRDMKMGKLANTRPMQIPPAVKISPDMERWRKSLPAYRKREEILHAVASNPVIIIQGETGCGKTTQVPQYILEQCRDQRVGCRIIVTEPRRLACTSVCERVCSERNETPGTTVGYQIRLESKLSPDTILTFCTPGIVMSAMLNEATMANVSHVIVDEIHERDRFCDFLLICLRDLRVRYPQLRIILMSATVNTQLFEKYFTCPVITVSGRTFPVKELYLLDMLKLTGYSRPAMLELQKKLRKDVKDGTVDKETFSAPVEKEDAAIRELDDCIEKAFNCGDDDSLAQLLHLLLSEGYPIDFKHSTTGITALMVAAARNQVQMMDTLLRCGADTCQRTRNGQTALELARIAEAADSVAYLESIQGIVPVSGEHPLNVEDQILLDSYLRTCDEKVIDVDLIVKLVLHILKTKGTGAILVFLPGSEDIIRCRDHFRAEESQMLDRPKYRLYLLHSQFRNDSKAVFKPAPDRARKVILSTNIAETSITIDDVVYVIDTGKVKQKSLDVINGISQLQVEWISKSCAEQRRGRAGRCQEGVCYRLYSEQRFNSMEKFTTPEILRTSLADLCLQAKMFAQNNCTIVEFLGKAVEPPTLRVSRDAVQLLKTIDALNAWEDLTPLGVCLLNLSTDPRYGKILLYAVILKCLDPVLTIVASLDGRDPFIIPTNADRKRMNMVRKKLAEGTSSDHFVFLRAYQGWQQAVSTRTDRAYCEENSLSASTMEVIQSTRSHLLGQLRALGLVRKQPGDMRELNSNSDSWAVVKAAICAGLYPNLARVDREQNVLRTRKECRVSFHSGSVLRGDEGAGRLNPSGNVSGLATDWVMYTELVKVGPFCHFRTCTLVSALTVALVCCPTQSSPDALHDDCFRADLADPMSDSEVEDEAPNTRVSLTVDDWIELRGSSSDIERITYARHKLQAVCLRKLAACASPNKSSPATHQTDDAFIKGLVSVITAEEKAANLAQPVGVGQRPKNVDGALNDNMQSMQINHSNPRNRNWQNPHPRAEPIDRSDASSCNGPTTRYFIVRSPSVKALELAFVRSCWQFSKSTERKLREAREEGGELILIFAAYQTFHGVAKLGLGQPQMGMKWPLHWIKKHAVSIESARNLPLPDELRNVPLNRDGLELPEHVGRALLRLWERSLMGPRPYHDDFNGGRGLRPFGFMRNM